MSLSTWPILSHCLLLICSQHMKCVFIVWLISGLTDCRKCLPSESHFHAYLHGNWINLDKNDDMDSKSGMGSPLEFPWITWGNQKMFFFCQGIWCIILVACPSPVVTKLGRNMWISIHMNHIKESFFLIFLFKCITFPKRAKIALFWKFLCFVHPQCAEYFSWENECILSGSGHAKEITFRSEFCLGLYCFVLNGPWSWPVLSYLNIQQQSPGAVCITLS